MSIFSENCNPTILVYKITNNVDIIYFGLSIIISYDCIDTNFNNSFLST